MGKPRGFLTPALCAAFLVAFALCGPAGAEENDVESWVRFSGYVWNLRQSEEPGGPLNNRFAGLGRSVILNPDKSLTLTISREGDRYYGGEAILSRALGYGTYIFRVRSRLSNLDPNLVLGLFGYSSDEKKAFDEVDVEFSAWGIPGNPVRGQYVVQPYDLDGHLYCFDIGEEEGMASYSIAWDKDSIEFLSWRGYGSRPAMTSPTIIAGWTYTSSKGMPDPRRAKIYMNLYLMGRPGPAGSGIASVVVDSFQFLRKK